MTVERVSKQAATEGQTKFVCERGSLRGSFREDVGFTVNCRQRNFSVMPRGQRSAGSAFVCLCTELPVMFLNTERRNNRLVLLIRTAIHTPTHNMSIKCRSLFLLSCSYFSCIASSFRGSSG